MSPNNSNFTQINESSYTSGAQQYPLILLFIYVQFNRCTHCATSKQVPNLKITKMLDSYPWSINEESTRMISRTHNSICIKIVLLISEIKAKYGRLVTDLSRKNLFRCYFRDQRWRETEMCARMKYLKTLCKFSYQHVADQRVSINNLIFL